MPLDGWRDNPTKKLYVWFDAVIGYLSASVEWARRSGDPDALAGVVERPRGPLLLLHGQGQHHLPLPDLAGRAPRLRGKGDKGGSPRELGALNLPTEVVSSEFLTMEGKKFSSSKRVVIYVRDMLARYQPDAFRYFVAAAGPENQDADFTWAEFVRRTNDELVAGWGNLVNRTATLVAKNFGEIPAAGDLTATDQALLDHVEQGFGVGRRPHRTAPAEAGDRRGDAGIVRGQQVRLRLRAVEAQGRRPARTARHDPARHGPVRSATCNPMLSPFLPLSANAVDAVWAARRRPPMPRLEEVEDLDGGAPLPGHHRRLHRCRWAGSDGRSRWALRSAKPTPVFTKLDPAVVDEELDRLAGLTSKPGDVRTAVSSACPQFRGFEARCARTSTTGAARCARTLATTGEVRREHGPVCVLAMLPVMLFPESERPWRQRR